MRWWSQRVVPRIVERSLRAEEFSEHRREACRGLSGRVVEIGFGSGLNVRHYPGDVDRVLAVEPSDLAWQLSAERRSRAQVTIERVGLDGARLPMPDASVDAVLSTWTLCTIPSAQAALSEVARVLRPGGTFQFVEHGLSPEARVARWQRRLDPWQRRLLDGCHLTRDIPRLISDAGLDLTELRQFYLPGPRLGQPFSYLSAGRAAAGPSPAGSGPVADR